MQVLDIVAVNSAAHAGFVATFEAALVAFTALDCEAARLAWHALAEQVSAHQAVEEELLAVLATYTDAPAPRGGATALVLAEHRRLDQLHAIAAQQIAVVQATPVAARRLAMVRALEDVLRFQRLLEHHGLREAEIVYPHVVELLPAEVCTTFAERLAGNRP